MEYAIIKTGGKQYKVAEGTTVVIEKLPLETGALVVFEEVLAYFDGETLTVGSPVVSGITVEGTVVPVKGEKISVRKFKAKSHYRRRAGHRQKLHSVSITSIKGGTKKKPAEKEVSAPKKPAVKTTTKKAPVKRTSAKKSA